SHVENLSGVFPLSTGSWGGSVSALLLPTQLRTEATNAGSVNPLNNFKDVGTFTPFDMRGSVAWARMLGQRFKVGAGLNVVGEQIDGNLSVGLSGDVGAMMDTGFNGWNLGFALQNLGLPATMVGRDPGFSPPIYVRLGSAYRLFDDSLILTGEGDMPIDNDF